MAGHSKWAKVKRIKGVLDAKKGKIFSKLAKEVTVAARLAGGDPALNPRLRMVLLKCRGANMPADNIDRAIKKGTGGGDGVVYEDLTYEIFAPHGVALLVELSTDNRNRTVAEIRHVFSKNGGNMGESNSVSWMFNRKGQIVIDAALKSEDEMMEIALEAGADDVTSDADTHQIFTAPEDFHSVLEAIKAKGIEPMSAELAMIPQNTIKLEGADAAKMLKLYEALDDHDDVQSVYANFEMDDSALE